MVIPSVVFDLAVIAILIICAAVYSGKGFLAGLLSFFGTLLSIIAAGLIGNHFAPIVFDRFFRPGIEQRALEAIAERDLGSLAELMEKLGGIIPDSLLESLEASMGAGLDFSAGNAAKYVVSEVVSPMVVPIVAIVLFFVLFLLLRLLVTLLSKVFTGVNKIPVIGTVNGALGAVMGILVGVLYVFLLLCVVWVLDATVMAGALSGEYLSRSFVLQLMETFNFFK